MNAQVVCVNAQTLNSMLSTTKLKRPETLHSTRTEMGPGIVFNFLEAENEKRSTKSAVQS